MNRFVTAVACLAAGLAPRLGHSEEPIPVGSPPPPIISVYVIDEHTRSMLPAGKEVDAIDGDLLIQSPHLTAVIAKPVEGRNANLTTNDVGGCLLDLTTTENSSDQLTVFRPHGPGVTYRKWSISIDGDDNSVAVDGGWGIVHSVALTVSSADDRYKATYILSVGDRVLTILTEGPADTEPADPEFRLDGGDQRVNLSQEQPGDWFWAEDPYWGQAYGIRVYSSGGQTQVARSGRKMKVTGAGPNVAYEIVAGRTRLHAWSELFDDVPKGQLGVVAMRPNLVRPTNRSRPRDVGFANVRVSTLVGNREVDLARFRVDTNERVSLPVPTGPIAVEMESHGSHSEPGRFHMTAGESIDYRSPFLSSFTPLQLIVQDDAGWPIAAKVELRTVEGDTKIDFGPDTAVNEVKNLVYVATGERTVLLPAGKYELRASHGPEYQVANATVEIPGSAARQAARITTGVSRTLTLKRAFETPGWISADFHSHSSPSGDNISEQRGRVLNLVCEDIDFAPCTEHNRISSYQSHIDELGLNNLILSCSGIELTGSPLPLNHHNVFPMVHKPFTQNGGGPYVADNPDEQVERLYLWDEKSRKVIQQNHPDMGWLLRDRDGNGEPDEGFARAVALLDCIEVHPVESVLELFPDAAEAKGEAAQAWNRGRFLAWLQLLNQGRRLTGVVNTDAHYNYHGSGWLRNWIQVPKDEPAECALDDIIESVKVGKVVMSNGPMLELTVTDEKRGKAGLGDEVRVTGKSVKATVTVRCADWVHCDRVALLVDGRPLHVFDTKNTADAFQDGPLVFNQTIDVAVDHDVSILAICGSSTETLGAIYGPDNADRHFAAATNPIWLNTGDDKWEPSNDTLDMPLQGKIQ